MLESPIAAVSVMELRCEYLLDPLGIDTPTPRLSWQLRSSKRGAAQAAYHILAGSAPGLADLWDSGRVSSPDPFNVRYAGKPLSSAQRVYWRVRAFLSDSTASAFSTDAFFETALLSPAAWSDAGWITAHPPGSLPSDRAPLLRKSFSLPSSVSRARLYVCGLGYFEAHLNGTKVGDRVVDPAQTDYEQRALYSTFDVTPLLRPGRNAIGLILGTGWFDQHKVWGGLSYGPPCAIALLRIDFADGSSTLIPTDSSWRTAPSPILSNNIYAGEVYDARAELPGWSTPAFDDTAWSPVATLPSPTARLESQTLPPIKITGTLAPLSARELRPGLWIYDLGQNFAGWARIRVSAPAGTSVRLRFAETLAPDGSLDTASTGVFATGVEQIDSYTCRGGSVEEWEPRFTYHGFRYVEVTGLPPGQPLDSLLGVVVHTAVEETSAFQCSDPLLERIHSMALWTLRSNLHGLPTDCPARERCGWLGDAHIAAEFAFLNFHMAPFWPKYLRDIETSRRGRLPGNVAPGKRCSEPDGNPDWGAAIIFIPWTQYLYTGDTDILREHYPAMRQFLLGFHALAADGIVSKGFGDWCPPEAVEPHKTPVALTSTAWLIASAAALAAIAKLLGHHADSDEYNAIASSTEDAFNRRFFDESANSYGSQTADCLALAFNLVPPGREQAVADALAADVRAHAVHHTTGIFGLRYLSSLLARHGHADLAVALLRQNTYPSIGHLISLGATTFWECWGEEELDEKWGARSLNHPMQAALDSFFFHDVLGIRPRTPAFRQVILHPRLLPGLSFARGHIMTPFGPITSSWSRTPSQIEWSVSLPPGITAGAHLPTSSLSSITESGHPLSTSSATQALDSGSYHFTFLP